MTYVHAAQERNIKSVVANAGNAKPTSPLNIEEINYVTV